MVEGDGDSDEPTLLLVDDDAVFRLVLGRALRSRGYRVLEAADYKDAVIVLRVTSPRYAVVDLRLAGPSGLDLAKFIKQIRPNTVLLLLTGKRSASLEEEVARLGARYLTKPVDADQVVTALSGQGD